MFEGLTGHTPFEGDNQFDIMQQHLNAKMPPLSKWGVEAPSTVEKLLQIAMSKDARDRYQTVHEIRAAMERELSLDDTQVAPARKSSGSRRGLALALGVLVAAATTGAGLWMTRARPADPKPKPKQETTANANAGWFAPLKLPGVQLSSDETYRDDRLRVQSVKARPAGELADVRERYKKIRDALQSYMSASEIEVLRKEATAPPPPLTVVLVPESVLKSPELWPGTQVKADADYPSRYMPRDRTLFLADDPRFQPMTELAYGIAMHRFANILSLTNEAVLSLAEKFEQYYNAKPAR
jgi:hypothetical protein